MVTLFASHVQIPKGPPGECLLFAPWREEHAKCKTCTKSLARERTKTSTHKKQRGKTVIPYIVKRETPSDKGAVDTAYHNAAATPCSGVQITFGVRANRECKWERWVSVCVRVLAYCSRRSWILHLLSCKFLFVTPPFP